MLALIALVAASARAQAGHPGPPEKTQAPAVQIEMSGESVEVPMRLEDGRILLDVRVGGKGPFPFVLDTGAQGGVVDLAFAREQGLRLGAEERVASPGGAGGQLGYVTSFGVLEIGALKLENLPSVAFDGLPFARSATSPRGVLSPYALAGLLVSLDYPHGRVVFRRGALPEPDGREVFGWDPAKELPEIPVTVAGHTIPAHLDSGGAGAVMLPDAMADQLPLVSPPVEVGRAKTVDQDVIVRAAQLAGMVTIGRYTIEKPTVHFLSFYKTQGNVGPPILRQFTITLDPANHRARLEGPPDGHLQAAEERPRRYGIRMYDPGASPLVVAGVDPGSPAAKGGLQVDDRILKINGRAVQELTAEQRMQILHTSPVHLVVQRGEKNLELEMSLE